MGISMVLGFFFFFSSRRRHTRYWRDWSSDVCSSDLSISEREIVGLVGESGSGKTLFTKCILGILPEISKITYDTFEVKADLGAVFQNAFTSLNPTMKIGKQRSEERRVGKECRSRWSPYH